MPWLLQLKSAVGQLMYCGVTVVLTVTVDLLVLVTRACDKVKVVVRVFVIVTSLYVVNELSGV